MSSHACTHQRFSLSSLLSFVKQELLHIPTGVRVGLLSLRSLEDLVQELHLAYREVRARATRGKGISRVLRAARRTIAIGRL